MTGNTLPRGIVTLLFTDVEGSTQLLSRLGDEYGRTLLRHREVLSAIFGAHGGVVMGSEGDSLFVAFEKPSSAVAATIAGQRALAAEAWPPDAAVRVRMGMHTGEVEILDENYVGMAVHVAARVSASAHGGQIVLTAPTARLAGNPATTDLGRHRLKDVGEFHLLQLLAPGLRESFPPLQTLSGLPNNLPAPVDSFVGRQMELAEIQDDLSRNRLVTLTGAGGSGKTRLALEVGAGVLSTFVDGVWFVPLATLDDGARLAELVARVLCVGDTPGETIIGSLQRWMAHRHLMLVLDNCEHLVDAAAAFCKEVLSGCAEVRILATSREVLGVRGEHVVRVPPLATEEDAGLAALSDAVRLFLARAAAAAPSLRIRDDDHPLVAAICRRLDGLPLAIELAAARLRSLSLAQLADRLDDRFRLLTGGARHDMPRQRTLEAVVTWSYDLLSDVEQHTFSRLGVFPDHFSLEMAQAVVSGEPVSEMDVMDTVAHLVDKSLVTTINAADGLRYQLLETLRDYGLERLIEGGEADDVRARLFAWAMMGVERLESVMRTPAMDDAIREATINAVTYRSAMQWAGQHQRHLDALRVASVVPLSHHRGERRLELLELLDRAEQAGELDHAAAGHAWAAIANIAFEQSDWEVSAQASESAAGHFHAAGATRLAAWAEYIGICSSWGAGLLEDVDRLVASAQVGFRQEGDDMGLGYVLWLASLRNSDLDAAKDMAEEADTLLRGSSVPMGIAHNVEGRGIIAFERGELYAAANFVSEAIDIFASYGNLGCTAHALEAAAVVLNATSEHRIVGADLLRAAEEFRLRSGQGHRPWEIRGRLGPLEDHIAPSPATGRPRAAGERAEWTLPMVTASAIDALRSVASEEVV